MEDAARPVDRVAQAQRTLWERLVEPSPHIQDIETRRQARLLASLLLILFPLLVIGNVASRLSGNEPFGAVVQTAAAIGVVIAYILCQTRYDVAGAALQAPMARSSAAERPAPRAAHPYVPIPSRYNSNIPAK